MKNSTELRNAVTSLYADVLAGKIDLKTAAELNNTLGKLSASNRVELEYHALRKTVPIIPFYNQPGGDSGVVSTVRVSLKRPKNPTAPQPKVSAPKRHIARTKKTVNR